MSDFTPEQVERAAEALWAIARVHGSSYSKSWEALQWEALHECAQRRYRREALTVLYAADAPERVAPVVDEVALADVLSAHVLWDANGGTASWAWVNCSCGERFEVAGVTREHVVALGIKHQARVVAAYLRGESK